MKHQAIRIHPQLFWAISDKIELAISMPGTDLDIPNGFLKVNDELILDLYIDKQVTEIK